MKKLLIVLVVLAVLPLACGGGQDRDPSGYGECNRFKR